VTDLVRDGFVPVVVEDCVASRKPGDRQAAVARMKTEGALVTTYESLLYELCRFSGTDGFRQILRLIK